MILKQIYLGCLAQASYLIADEESKVAAIVDPRRDIDEYLAEALSLGLSIQHVILTHFHADFLAGHLELVEHCGARIYLGARGEADYDFVPLRDGDVIEMGKVRLTALETPGHTPESICILVHDLAKDGGAQKPHAVLTGDTLFIGDVGRPDLMASVGVTAEELAGQLYDSLHQKLLPLPDETMVYPGHGAGSMCGKNLSAETFSSMRQQRLYNHALQDMSKEEFVTQLTADLPTAPAYFGYDAQLNRGLRPLLEQAKEKALRPLSLEQVLELQENGARVLNVRTADDYARSHLLGSIQIGLVGKFATWCGTILDPKQPIVLITDPGKEEEAILRLGRIGFDHVSGFLEGGFVAAKARPELLRSTGRVTVQELPAHLEAHPDCLLLDVRAPGEVKKGAIQGMVHIPLSELTERMGEVPGFGPIVVYCGSGYRSAIAMSLIEGHGNPEVVDLIGGYAAWAKALAP